MAEKFGRLLRNVNPKPISILINHAVQGAIIVISAGDGGGPYMSDSQSSSEDYHPISRSILAWYDINKRHLPWRDNPTPYWVLLSEYMLQQTQVETVKPYFERFTNRFPTLKDLAMAEEDEVMSLWAGLGYYSRARNLLKAARQINASGQFPVTIEGLLNLPGVGPYIAGAVGSIALGLDVGAVDGNHHRVFSRLFRDSGNRNTMWKHAERLLPIGRSGDFNQALMDLGSSICTNRSPTCNVCPLNNNCQAHQEGDVASFPLRKKRKPKPTRLLISGILETEAGLFLCRRPDRGLFGGLYEPPTFFCEAQSEKSINEAWLNDFGVAIDSACIIGSVRHTLTHMHMDVQVYRVSASTPTQSVSYNTLSHVQANNLASLGLSTLAQKIIACREHDYQPSLFSVGISEESSSGGNKT